MSTIDEIKAALDEMQAAAIGYSKGGRGDSVFLERYEVAAKNLNLHAPVWLRELLAENERLAAIVDAVKKLEPALDTAMYEFRVRRDSAEAGRDFGSPGVEFWQQAIEGVEAVLAGLRELKGSE